jgi:hypothetical protein
VVRTRHADGQKPGPEPVLAGDERRSTGGAALLRIRVGEHHPLFGNAIAVRGLVTHDAVVIGADVVDADVVTPDYRDVRFVLRRRGACQGHHQHLWRIAYASAEEVDSHLRLLTAAGAVHAITAGRALETFDQPRAMTWRLLNPLQRLPPRRRRGQLTLPPAAEPGH